MKMEVQSGKITAAGIGRAIRRLRLIHGETQQELGEQIGYGATTVANYERGYRLPDVITFLKIVLRYEAVFEDFTNREDEDETGSV